MKKAFLIGTIFCALMAAGALWAQQTSTAPATPAEIQQRVEAYLRQYYAWGPAFQVKIAAPTPSPIPGVYEVAVSISYKGQTDNAVVYVSHDGHYMIRGALDSLLVDPFAASRTKLESAISHHPHVGPAKACVNVVEFFDFECPHCRDAYMALQQILPRYPQVRFTFMDFPLSQIHPWAYNAALAGRCAYQENPADYPKLQQEIFDQQDQITAENASTKLLTLAAEAGLNSSTMEACMALPATHKEVDDDIATGKSLDVNSTPTLFVDGRPMVGGTEQLLEQYISYDLGKCQPGQPSKPAAK